MHMFIKSITIKADSRQLLFIDDAKLLLDIMIQQKQCPEEYLVHKFAHVDPLYRNSYRNDDNALKEADLFYPTLTSTEATADSNDQLDSKQ